MNTMVLDRSGSDAKVVQRETLAQSVFVTVTTIAHGSNVVAEPIEMTSEGVAVRPEFMTANRLYPFRLFGEDVVAIKRPGGAIDFYTVP